MSTPYKCQRCGLANSMGSVACAACGRLISSPKKQVIPPQRPQPQQNIINNPPNINNPLSNLLNMKRVEGRVVHVDSSSLESPDFNWRKLLILIGIMAFALYFLLPVIVGSLIVFLVISILLYVIFPKLGKSMSFLVGGISFMLRPVFPKKHPYQKPQVPVLNIRVRDVSGREYLVRIKGHIVSGNIIVGDEVIMEGYDRGGTIKLSRGYNKRINSKIKIKRR